jgi:hypothetical protein
MFRKKAISDHSNNYSQKWSFPCIPSFYCKDKVNKSEGDINAVLIASEFTRSLGTNCGTDDTDDDILEDMSRLSMMDKILLSNGSVGFNAGTNDWG